MHVHVVFPDPASGKPGLPPQNAFLHADIQSDNQASKQQATQDMKTVLSLLYLVTAANCDATCFDHQTADYTSQFDPAECNKKCTVTPFFSPDHSLDTYMDLIQSATETIDIYTPGECVCFFPLKGTCIGSRTTHGICQILQKCGSPTFYTNCPRRRCANFFGRETSHACASCYYFHMHRF